MINDTGISVTWDHICGENSQCDDETITIYTRV